MKIIDKEDKKLSRKLDFSLQRKQVHLFRKAYRKSNGKWTYNVIIDCFKKGGWLTGEAIRVRPKFDKRSNLISFELHEEEYLNNLNSEETKELLKNLKEIDKSLKSLKLKIIINKRYLLKYENSKI